MIKKRNGAYTNMTIEEIRTKYPYLYETHLHTKEASACAHNTAEEMVLAAKAYGYTGIFITDHHIGGNTCVDKTLPWKQWVETFFASYRNALPIAEKCDIQVFPAYEACFDGTEFLIYGITEEWMKEHEELASCSIERQYELVHQAEGFVVHAHPYREESYIPEVRLFPDYIDAVEAINATHSNSKSKAHNDKRFDDRAIQYARTYDFPMTAGSDIHFKELLGGGIAFSQKIYSGQDYYRQLQSGDYVLTNGENWFDPKGNLIYEA